MIVNKKIQKIKISNKKENIKKQKKSQPVQKCLRAKLSVRA